MNDPRLTRIRDIMGKDEDVRLMVRLMLDQEGATSLEHLRDMAPDAYELICDEADSLVEQGTP